MLPGKRPSLSPRSGSPMCDLCYEEERTARKEIKVLSHKLKAVTEALDALVIVNGREIGYRTMHNIPMQMAKSIEKKVRVALAAAKEEP
jgi:hypothetical protein